MSEDQQDLVYNGQGNILYKRGVGHYEYAHTYNTAAANDAGHHAVTGTSDGYTYLYDNNGNRIEDHYQGKVERRFRYTTFDKPDLVSKGPHRLRLPTATTAAATGAKIPMPKA